MKRFFLGLLTAIVTTGVYAQVMKVADVFKEGTVWEQTVHIPSIYLEPGQPREYKEYYELKGSYEIDGRQCMKMIARCDNGNERDFCYIYTEGEKVWFHRLTKYNEWYLLYAFDLKQGEECTVYDGAPIDNEHNSNRPASTEFVETSNSAEYGSHDLMQLRQFTIDGDKKSDFSMNYRWIQGIGGIDGVMGNVSYEEMCGAYPCHLEKVTTTEGVVFQYDPAGINSIESTADEDIAIYDLYGKRISQPEPGQIYIQNNKKYILK